MKPNRSKGIITINLIIGFGLFFTACDDNKVQEIELLDKSDLNYYEYAENSNLADKINISKYSISLADGSNIESYCMYNSVIYYAVSSNTSNNLSGTGTYTVKIVAHYAVDNKEEILYNFESTHNINVSDLQCNGKYLIWIEYNDDNNGNIVAVNLNDFTDKKYLFEDTQNISDNFSTISLTEDGLYWLKNNNNEDNCDLCRYDIETGNTDICVSDINTDNLHCGFYMQNTNYIITEAGFVENTMRFGSIYSDYQTSLKVKPYINDPVFNEKFCAWNASSNNNIYVYDFLSKKLESIGFDYFTSYGIVGDYLIVNKYDGIYCYDIEDKQYCRLVECEELMSFELIQGKQNDVCVDYTEDIMSDNQDTHGKSDSVMNVILLQ